MKDHVAVVTGATSGIGLHIARGLATAGYEVVIVARNEEKARAARAEIGRAAGDAARVHVELANLASLDAVEALAGRIAATYPDLSLLVNNAGVLAAKKELSPDGIDLELAVNHVAPFLLTWRLLPPLRRRGGRVVNVNSDSHEKATLEQADLAPGAPYKFMASYGKSKLASMAATVELASRIPPGEVMINAVHPGMVATNIGASGGVKGVAWALMKPFLLSPQKGAETPVWAGTSPDLAGASGNYYKTKALAEMNPQARDRHIREMVWAWTLDLAHIHDADRSASASSSAACSHPGTDGAR